MQTSSSRFKSFAVSSGISFWFFIITSSIGIFTLELFAFFIIFVLIVTQIFTSKVSKGLDIFAIINTKLFLGILFIFVVSVYGILFKFLRIDLLRTKKQKNSYWLDMKSSSNDLRKQY